MGDRLHRRFVGRLLVLEECVTDLASGAVHVAFGQQSENSAHGAVLGSDGRALGYDGSRDRACYSHLISVGEDLEGLVDVLHIGSATGEDDAAKEFAHKFVGHLMPCVLNDLLQASLDNLHKLRHVDAAVVVDGIGLFHVDLAGVGVGRGIFEFHLLCCLVLHLQGCEVLGDVVAAKGNDGQVTKNIAKVDRNGCCLGS